LTDEAAHPSLDIGGMPLSESGSANAPFIYFETAPAFGLLNGIARISLEATRTMPLADGGTFTDRVVTGHLRMNLQAAMSLKSAVEAILLMASTPPTHAKN
jgi:hypothetical protein